MGGPIGTLQGPEHAHRGIGDKCSHGDWGQLATGSLGTNAHKGTGDKCSQGDWGQMLTGVSGDGAPQLWPDICNARRMVLISCARANSGTNGGGRGAEGGVP